VDNVRMDLVGVRWDDADWIDLAQDRNRLRALALTTGDLELCLAP
jgi:hypothetical protein